MAGRDRLRLALVVVLSAAAGCLTAEAGLRLLHFRFDTYPSVQFGWPEPTVIANEYRPDYDLFWVPRDYDQVLADARTRHPAVVFMGDSCTQFGTYPSRTLRRLASDGFELSTGVKVGVGGWSTEQGLAQLRRDVLPLRPRVITVYFGWNDHWVALGPPDREARPSRLYYWMNEHSRLVQLVTKVRLGLAARTVNRPNRVPIDEYRENLEAMAGLARAAGIRLILVTAPSGHEPGHEPAYLALRHLRRLDDLIPLHRAYVAATRTAAQAAGVELCDAAAAFTKLPEPAPRYFTHDGIHFNPAGNQAMADILARCIESRSARSTS